MRIALYNLHFATLGGGERRTALLAAHLAAQGHRVALFSECAVDQLKIRELFGIDLSQVENFILSVEVPEHAAAIAAFAADLFINNSYGSRLPSPARRGIYMCMFPEGRKANLETYQVITANSEFTSRWIAQLWGRMAEVVYSAVEPMGPPSARKNIILNVARFQADTGRNHFKHQDFLLEAFYQLRPDPSWEMHFAGNIGGQPGDPVFAREMQERAQGHPVHFHFGIPQNALRELYRSSSLYWHATGCDDAEGQNPARQEHFGMTLLEAMSAGAVPLAFRGGGPCETISHGESGWLWTDLDDLLAQTRTLIANPALRENMAAQSLERSRRFDKNQYLACMDAIISQLFAG